MNALRSASHALLLSALVMLGSPAHATDVQGKVMLGAYKPAPETQSVGRPFNWEVENGFKETKKDRIDARREIAVVLVGKTRADGEKHVELKFSGGSLLPSTVVVRAGATVRITNSDEVAHELFAEGLEGFSAEATSPRGMRSIAMREAGNWPLRDRLIPHLRGHLHVIADLVAVAKVDERGSYSFSDVLPGSYTLKVFHGPDEVGSSQVEVGSKKLSVDPITATAKAKAKAEKK